VGRPSRRYTMALFKKEASETNTATLDPQTPNQESPSKDLASIILRKEGKKK